MEVYIIKVTLPGTKPPVWRRIPVPREITLRNLHRTLQTVMGWTDAHLHQFILPGARSFGLSRDSRERWGTRAKRHSGPCWIFPEPLCCTSTTLATAGVTNWFSNGCCPETNRFGKCVSREIASAPREIREDRRDLLSCSKHSRSQPVPSTHRFANGSVTTVHLDLSKRRRSIENCGVDVVDRDPGARQCRPGEGTIPPREARIR